MTIDAQGQWDFIRMAVPRHKRGAIVEWRCLFSNGGNLLWVLPQVLLWSIQDHMETLLAGSSGQAAGGKVDKAPELAGVREGWGQQG